MFTPIFHTHLSTPRGCASGFHNLLDFARCLLRSFTHTSVLHAVALRAGAAAVLAAERPAGAAGVARVAVREALLERLQAALHGGAVFDAGVVGLRLAERVDTRGERRLRGEHAGHGALVGGRGLGDELRVVEDAVLGRRLALLQGAEEGL